MNAVIFRSHVLSLLKLHIFAHLIESCPTVHDLSSCIGIKLSIPQAAHTTVTVYTCRAVIFLHFQVFLFFCLTSYPAEIAYFNSPNGELCYGVRVMALYSSKNVDPFRSPCLKTVQRKNFQRGIFLVLRPVLLEIAYFNSDNR